MEDSNHTMAISSRRIGAMLLPLNTILALTEGKDDVLWIGTRNGLVSMDKKTGKFTTHRLSGSDNRIIYTLFTSHDGKIWIGTDQGITCYLPEQKTFFTYSGRNTTLQEENGKKYALNKDLKVKSFTEDRYGNIYIGTWSECLYRLDCKKRFLYQYNLLKLGETGYTYLLKMDSKGRLWICTWGRGIKCMTQPLNQKNPGFIDLYRGEEKYGLNYNLTEDVVSHTIWACSRNGYGVINTDNIQEGFTYYNTIGNQPARNITDVKTDGKGNV